MEVLTISLGRNILKQGSREYVRMQGYAKHLEALHVVVLTRREHGYTEVVHEGNLHLYPTNSLSRILMLWDAFFISRKIAKETRREPLVISAQDPLEIGWLCALLSRLRGTRLHVQVHGDYFSGAGWVGSSWTRRLRRRVALFLLRHAPHIRVVSERIKKTLVVCGVPAERMTVLPIRPEIESFLATSREMHTDAPCTFLYVGRLAEEKDIPRILRAFVRVHGAYPATRLRIVGDGEMKNDIVSLISALHVSDAVSLVPWTEDVPNEMVNADIFLLASLHEAYALTLVEAMATGLPIITTDVGCVGEVVVDGVQGIVVYEDGVAPYASAMERMVTDIPLRKSCGRAGKEAARALARVSADQYAQAWVTALER